MNVSSFLPLCDGLRIERVTETPPSLVVSVLSLSSQACCPVCNQVAERRHSQYIRCISDLACVGQHVTLLLSLSKFFCQNSACPRKIFTERLPHLVQSSARLTNRLRDALVTLGFATCGEVASRIAPLLGMHVTPTTLLRYLRAVVIPPPTAVRLLGVDDWAWRKGQTYGTILVDLELHRPIELLPDRSAETLETWLRLHPEIEVISRDRAGAYATAARKGAPQAQQIADRFHLLKNVRERLKDLMERKQSYLPDAGVQGDDAIPQKAQGMKRPEEMLEIQQEKHYRAIPPHPYQRPAGLDYNASQKQVRRSNRYARYEAVRTLYQQGNSIRAISRQFDLCRETVRTFVRAEVFPELCQPVREKKRSILDPYKPYLLQRWQHGCWNGAQLYDEIKARGYSGSGPLLRIFLKDLRKKHRETGDPAVLILDTSETKLEIPLGLSPKPHVKHPMSPTCASWLCISQFSTLSEKQQRQVKQI